MSYFQLPIQAKKNKSIPKNSFYDYASTKQKQFFVEVIDKIKWQYKLAPDTINLQGEEVQEIQIFEISLKKKKDIDIVLSVIEKAIPYHIIFIISYDNDIMLYTSQKHAHPVNENNAVVDWVFKTEWFKKSQNKYRLSLKNNLDEVYRDFCFQLSNNSDLTKKDLKELIEKERKLQELNNKITRIESEIKRTKQFNKKQPLNSELNELKRELLYLKNTED